jgi:multiple sugar transport system ATP-binding protein
MALELKNLHKSFGPLPVVDDVSLSVGGGEIVVIFGASGTGKTVLLRILAGIHDVDGGAILVDGRDVTDAGPDARGIGMAFQNFALFPHMSAFDNVASPLTAQKRPRAEIAARVAAIATLLKIEQVLGHFPSELSNGQKQRTALARALVGAPKVLLLDDPLRNVDAKLRYEMRLELPNLLKKSGSAVLYVTQDYREAMALGDRIALLSKGKIVQLAPPTEVYERPATLEVARLFGDPTINLVAVKPSAAAHGTCVRLANSSIQLGHGYDHAVGLACMLGLRPETIKLQEEPGENVFPVDIVAETPLNEKTVVLTKTADGAEILVSRPSAVASMPDGRAYAAIDPQAALLFDAGNGRLIERSLQ